MRGKEWSIMVEVLEERCIGCGKCAADCFPENLTIGNGKAHVEGPCMECGHCYAVCPVDAIRITGYPTDGVIQFQTKKPSLDGEELLNFIKSRRSIRKYQDKPVPADLLCHILEAGRFTPTGGNAQDVHYIVVQEHLDELKKLVWEGLLRMVRHLPKNETGPYAKIFSSLLADYESQGKDRLFFNAPVLLIVASHSMLDGGLAASNIELMANAEGLGTLYSGFIQMALSASPEACSYLKITKSQIRVCMLMGYPDVTFRRTAPRKEIEIAWN